MINEFNGRSFTCAQYIPTGPGYQSVGPYEHTCYAVGSQAGASVVDGGTYIDSAYQYVHSHKWRCVLSIMRAIDTAHTFPETSAFFGSSLLASSFATWWQRN